MVEKKRLDVLLIEKGLEESRSKAAARIMAGQVVVNDQMIDKPGTQVKADAHIRLKGKGLPFVSRGGLKIEGAFGHWPIPTENRICLDVGASTGGFTDFLLQKGAQRVFAVDVGYGQLHWKLQTDERVTNMERTHILKTTPDDFDETPDLCVMDVSFISVAKILPHLQTLLAPKAELVILVKPQFELSAAEVGKGGIVRDAEKRQKALKSICDKATELGLEIVGHMESPIQGAEGNIEFLLYLKHDGEISV
ncbi:MAG: TlyA family rRNA (cytidine-2'-O)-methyltransferase [Myxococcales bacterium]|nr:TlyA family rRNA (cytidine-2'-O)-methyltransferase [Myxococcales bacterium]|tara:strand:- start:686 stop:1438 length:753 start_codon:yes stop_codon:yes gene_type:complete